MSWLSWKAARNSESKAHLDYTPGMMSQDDTLAKAIAIAVEAHKDQKDRYGASYILHPLRVMARVSGVVEKIVAVLHDVVEDTDWTLEDLRREGFSEEILCALDSVTKRDGEEYENFVQRSAANPVGRRVKLADLEDNMDLRRFPELEETDLPRLRKYLKAWHALNNLGPIVS